MTTPEGAPDGATTSRGTSAPKARVRRAPPDRTGPIRAAGPAAAPSAADASGQAAADGAAGSSINEQIAQAVRAGYDVITDNIQQGRQAAERFRQGDYNFRDVPDDVQSVLQRLIQLARELSTTTFDVCDRLLAEWRPTSPPAPPTDGPPPFRPRPEPKQAPAPTAAPGNGAGPGQINLAVQFEGAPDALARTLWLDRPSQPAEAQTFTSTPLASADPTAPVISQVIFKMDLSQGGLVAVVTVPPGLPTGVYSGLVRAPGDGVPLGVLAVEIR